MIKSNFNVRTIIKKLAIVAIAGVVVLASSASVRADELYRETKNASTSLGTGETMYTSITIGENLVQGTIGTTTISDMYITGTCRYSDLYNSNVTRSVMGAREQDYSCVAYISKTATVFTYAQMEYTAYSNDGDRGYQYMTIGE